MEVLDAHMPEHGILLDQLRAGLQGGFPWHRADDPHPYPGDAERWWEAIEILVAGALARAGVERAECTELARAVRARFIDPTVGWRLFNDAVPALTALTDAGWTNAIISNHVPELADLVLGVGLEPHIDRVFTSALVGFDKPNPHFSTTWSRPTTTRVRSGWSATTQWLTSPAPKPSDTRRFWSARRLPTSATMHLDSSRLSKSSSLEI